MTVSTTSAAFYITPVVFKTFFKHVTAKGRKFKDGDDKAVATDDVFFDEAFHIVKAFIQMGTENTVESLQAFTNTHVPAPYWAAVSQVLIPLSCCNRAADMLIDWFGPEDLKLVVGGEKWWQVRGLDGLDAEWVTEKEYLAPPPSKTDRKYSTEEMNIVRMDHLETVMLYVHGGGYFWGSINTHRYQIIRYSRKINGRCFAVNYRKAPQYPWPCPLQDVLAAWFYLTEPPPGALHKPVPPSKIVIAGDSAGGGLCIAALTVLRDMGYEQPAGAVLISPWVDLTHSFPSVMKNTETDIIPPYGFIHKPSPIWPIHPLPLDGEPRVVATKTNPPPAPGHADTLRPSPERAEEQVEQKVEQSAEEGHPVHSGELEDAEVKSQKNQMQMLDQDMDERNTSSLPDKPAAGSNSMSQHGSPSDNDEKRNLPPPDSPVQSTYSHQIKDDDPNYDELLAFWEPKPPKVLMEDPNEQPLELRSQIQLYAMNEQLTHPLVSPVLQGSLGNLCPLYILAGDGEVLRDEIVYLAHKAANPDKYPTRKGILKDGVRQRENAQKFTKPTRVHLQVFDGMCHVLTVFTFTDSAKYAYRSIAEFVKHVTTHDAAHLEQNPFPEFHIPPAAILDSASEDERDPHQSKHKRPRRQSSKFLSFMRRSRGTAPVPVDSQVTRTDINLYRENEEIAKQEVESNSAAVEMREDRVQDEGERPQDEANGHAQHASGSSSDNTQVDGEVPDGKASGRVKDIAGVVMLRERVDIFGQVRPMEPEGEIEALHIPARLIGIIKEEPVTRWLTGQELWDKRYHKAGLHAIHQREHYEKKYAAMIEKARSQGLELVSDRDHHRPAEYRRRRASTVSIESTFSTGEVVPDKRYGPLDVDDERPASSAIVGRRDNRESIALVKKCIYYKAPATHKTIPKRSASDAIRAAFDRDDNPVKAPKQSVSEQQTDNNILPMHGLRMWQNIITMFMRKSSAKSTKARRRSMPNLASAAGRASHSMSRHGRHSAEGEGPRSP
ncbi:alpha/beta-hydrolase [Phanerochaete sordida]|uniref:Alpha/beta-hydrolase n=1 Tax=Phanerochaete sordida TaxID=48140 RepID=A0A9P3L7S0_9APHY|nr:alpha/beta-hydrolase [Phanerochaete sordida]